MSLVLTMLALLAVVFATIMTITIAEAYIHIYVDYTPHLIFNNSNGGSNNGNY